MWFAWMAALTEAWAQSLQCGDRVGVTYAGDYANIRASACGSVIGRIRAGNEGQIASSSCSRTCSIGGTSYTFWDVRPHGWIAQGTSTQRWLVPMPGQGYYPNVSTQGAYPIQVYIDANNIPGLPVRAGPGLGYPEITGRRNPGETGTAYAVWVNRNEQIVWWRIRWSNGDIGWSADAKIPYGVYLIKTGGYSSFTTVQLRLEASGAGGSVGIKVYTPDLDAAVSHRISQCTHLQHCVMFTTTVLGWKRPKRRRTARLSSDGYGTEVFTLISDPSSLISHLMIHLLQFMRIQLTQFPSNRAIPTVGFILPYIQTITMGLGAAIPPSRAPTIKAPLH
jgi:hypothetical protein